MSSFEDRIESLQEDKSKDTERIQMLENCRESIELKTSRKDIMERIAVASKQFKVLDIDFGKEASDRKELLVLAKRRCQRVSGLTRKPGMRSRLDTLHCRC
jgi:hypothetical protein